MPECKSDSIKVAVHAKWEKADGMFMMCVYDVCVLSVGSV